MALQSVEEFMTTKSDNRQQFHNNYGAGSNDKLVISSNLIQFSSSRQITEECERILKEDLANSMEDPLDPSNDKKLSSFRDLLSWKMPEHFCSNSNQKTLNRQRVDAQ